jgi:Tol biopolymer transport system component
MSSRAPRPLVALGVVPALLLAALLPATPALASFEPPMLVSGSPTIQADYAYSPAISEDASISATGRSGYVVFTGSVNSKPGVYRKDLQTGALQLVAGGDASAPSVSKEGRYVSFTASQNPITGASECSAVWVRDMEPEAGEPEYELVSALSGSTQSLTYTGSSKPGCPGGGSAAASRVALSASGREVAFTVIGESDLGATAGAGAPAPTATVPPDQVAMRDLATDTTTLVSATLASQEPGATPEPVPGGAALAGEEVDKEVGALGDAGIQEDGAGHPISASTASISADGSTVAWMGVNIPEQAPAAVDDEAQAIGNKYTDDYDEPLWRRVDAGPAAPTRRILGGDDPASPTGQGPLNLHWIEPTGTELTHAVGPIEGGYIELGNFKSDARYQDATTEPTFESITPQLSKDGETVALLSTAPPYGAEPTYGAGSKAPANPPSANAFVVNMASGLTRSQALIPLTEWGSDDFKHEPANTAPIADIAISPDGTRVAFTTERTIFPLTPPVLITPQVTTTTNSQLYEVDLRSNTLALVSEDYEGGPAEGDVYSPSFSGNGDALAFASGAPNLVYGASNAGDSDVFAISSIATPEAPGQQSIAPPPSDPLTAPQWLISATARRGAGGSLLLEVSVPGAGKLQVVASAAVPVAATAKKSTARGGRRTGSHQRSGNANTRASARTAIATRTLTRVHVSTAAPGIVQLLLLPAIRYRALEERDGGLYATIAIAFTAPGQKALAQTLQASFELAEPAHSARRKTTHDRTAKRGAGGSEHDKRTRRGT